jgi:uncharacterized protein YbcC (UPF0753/DUF2309 family)
MILNKRSYDDISNAIIEAHGLKSILLDLKNLIMSSNIRIEKVCQYCGTKFIAKTMVTRYCSHTCNRKAYKLEQRNAKISNVKHAIRNIEERQYQSINNPVYLTVRETSAILKCSTKMIYFLINTGRLKAINLSVRKTRINLQDLALIY